MRTQDARTLGGTPFQALRRIGDRQGSHQGAAVWVTAGQN